MAPTPERDGRHDFDFLHGTWRIHNRKLRSPLTGSDDWYEFEGRSVERPIWGGQANLEEYDATLPDGTEIHGLALRLYDVNARHWTIHWSDSSRGTLDPAMTGTFRDGVGEFLSQEMVLGRMVLVRFPLDQLRPQLGALGTGLLHRPRPHVGDELDHGVQSDWSGVLGVGPAEPLNHLRVDVGRRLQADLPPHGLVDGGWPQPSGRLLHLEPEPKVDPRPCARHHARERSARRHKGHEPLARLYGYVTKRHGGRDDGVVDRTELGAISVLPIDELVSRS